jgi:hypothetical protein
LYVCEQARLATWALTRKWLVGWGVIVVGMVGCGWVGIRGGGDRLRNGLYVLFIVISNYVKYRIVFIGVCIVQL